MASKKVVTEDVVAEVKEEAVQETNKAEAQVAPAAEVPNVPAPVAEPKQSLWQKTCGAIKAAPKKIGEAIEKHPKIAAGVALVVGAGAGIASNSAVTVTSPAGIANVYVPAVAPAVTSIAVSPFLTDNEPAFNCLPSAGATVNVTVASARILVAGLAVIVPHSTVATFTEYLGVLSRGQAWLTIADKSACVIPSASVA